jgi:hypothetical protein
MKRLLLVVAVALGLGCGGSVWEGTYTGTFFFSDICTDGFASNTDQNTEWMVTQNGGVLTISQGDAPWCGNLTADIEGSVAVFRPKVCLSYVASDGVTYYPELTSGTVSLNGDRLTGSENFMIDFSSGSCSREADVDVIQR